MLRKLILGTAVTLASSAVALAHDTVVPHAHPHSAMALHWSDLAWMGGLVLLLGVGVARLRQRGSVERAKSRRRG